MFFAKWRRSGDVVVRFRPGGAARHFPANYMPFAGAEIFVREHACVRAENFLGRFLICGAEF